MSEPTISREDAEEYSQSLAQIGEGWWRQIAWAFRQKMPGALGMTRREWRQKYFGYMRISLEERPTAVAELSSEGMNNSEIADALGVSEGTVRSDRRSDSQDYESENDDRGSSQIETGCSLADSQNYESEPLVPGEEGGSIHVPLEGEADPADDSMAELEDAGEPDALAAPDPPEPAAPGWHRLGDHLLYCGDSTDPEFVDACQGAFAFADPPYNAGKAAWDQEFKWAHDYLADAVDVVAVTPGIAALADFHTVTGMPYQWSIAAEITNGMARGALGFGNWIYVALFSKGSIYRNAKDYLRVPAHTSDDAGGSHAARKPLRLLTALIGLFTSKGDSVIDPFLGSGTTLLAADRLGRRCIGAEIDPMHCAEIIQRYENGTGS